MAEPAPPAYDDVVTDVNAAPTSISQPSAPPLEAIAVQYPEGPPGAFLQEEHHPASAPAGQRSSSQASNKAASSSSSPPSTTTGCDACVTTYTDLSIALRLRAFIYPPEPLQDPELDVEAQFGRAAVSRAQKELETSRKKQCLSGWMWCFGVILAFFYISAPVAMFVTGCVGLGECPFRSNTILIYLILGGLLLAVTVLGRMLPSVMTCCKLKDYCKTRQSNLCSALICTFEGFFYAALLANIAVMCLGTYWVFSDIPVMDCEANVVPAVDCCDKPIFIASAFFNIFQYFLLVASVLYLLIVFGCLKKMK